MRRDGPHIGATEDRMSHLAFALFIAAVLAAGALTVALGQAVAGALPVAAGSAGTLALALALAPRLLRGRR